MNKLNRQAGILIFLTPFLLVVLAIIITLGMDIARLSSVKSEMQNIVNAAATAAADEAQACGAGDLGLMKERALIAARRAGFEGNEEELEVFVGLLAPNPEDTEVLKFERTGGVDIEQSNAAVVRYTQEMPLSSLLPESFFPPIELSVNAASRKELYATLSATSSTASVSDGLLGNLLGIILGQSNYSLDPTDLASLENTLIGVGDLLDALGIDDVTSLVDRPLVDVLGAVTGLVGGVTTPVGELVDDLTGAVGVSGLDTSAVLEIVGGSSVPRDTEFPLYAFVMSTALNSVGAINKNSSALVELSVDLLDSSLLTGVLANNPILGVTPDVTLKLGVGEPPKIVIGPARKGKNGEWLTAANGSDIFVEAGINVKLKEGVVLGTLTNVLSVLGIHIDLLESIQIPLAIKTGGGTGSFINASCARGSSNEADLDILITANTLSLQSGTVDGSTGSVNPEPINAEILKLKLTLLNLITLVDLEVGIKGDIGVFLGGDSALKTITLDIDKATDTSTHRLTIEGDQSSNKLEVNIKNLEVITDGTFSGLGKIVTFVLQTIVPVLETVVNVILAGLLDPLLQALGVNLGSLEVAVSGADQLSTQLIENVEITD